MSAYISEGRHLRKIIHFGHEQVFANSSTYTCLLFADKKAIDEATVVKVSDLSAWRLSRPAEAVQIRAERFSRKPWSLLAGASDHLFERLLQTGHPLKAVTERIFQGLKTGADSVYVVDLINTVLPTTIASRATGEVHVIESGLLHPLIKGGDSEAYFLRKPSRRIIFPYKEVDGSSRLIPESEFVDTYPLTWNYLSLNHKRLKQRDRGRIRSDRWYGYSRAQALDVIRRPKIFTPDIALRPSFSTDQSGEMFFSGGVAGGYGIIVAEGFQPRILLGILNSRVIHWLIKQLATVMRGGYYSFESRFIRHLPIPELGKEESGLLLQYVTEMCKLRDSHAASHTAQGNAVIQRQIDALDRQIDQLVYELYGLSDKEIKIVEEATKR